MRDRITYLLSRGTAVDPAHVSLRDDTLTYARASEATEERRWTIGVSDLPDLVQAFLRHFHELHIRLSSPRNWTPFSPAVSRLPAGLHLFYTPKEAAEPTNLCFELARLFHTDLRCADRHPFSKPPVLSERFASTSTYQFFHDPAALSYLSNQLARRICPELGPGTTVRGACDLLAAASGAAYVDYDYDAISHAVTVTILTPPSERAPVRKIHHEDRLEIGILSPETAAEAEEIKLGGYLLVLGEDDKPSPTMFSFPARHHPLPSTQQTSYSVSFQQPTGLHPKLDITFPANTVESPAVGCALHAYWTLPSSVFIDSYQFGDPLFLASHHLVSLRALSGEQDLEAPDWAVQQWGSAALVELATPQPGASQDWKVTIPTHLRYVNHTASSPESHAPIQLPWPVVFWACDAEEGLKMSTNPFDRINLGYDGLFGPKTMFYHVPPSSHAAEVVEVLPMPVLQPEQATWVPIGTLIAVLAGFGWVCWKLFSPTSPPTADDDKKRA